MKVAFGTRVLCPCATTGDPGAWKQFDRGEALWDLPPGRHHTSAAWFFGRSQVVQTHSRGGPGPAVQGLRGNASLPIVPAKEEAGSLLAPDENHSPPYRVLRNTAWGGSSALLFEDEQH